MKIWQTKPSDENFARRLADDLHLPALLARVLGGYGFSNVGEVARFLAPQLREVSDPFLIPGMEAASARIWRAVENKESILVYGDYDVDGIAGAALLAQVLRRLGAGALTVCLPDRLEEGYGLSPAALQRGFKRGKPDLIITVDCGITAAEPAEFIRAAGIELVITDHHEPGNVMPAAAAIVNPKLGGPEHLKMLAGVGVVFKLCHAMLKHGKKNKLPAAEIDLREHLDLVALGTVADIVPLLNENRIFVRRGLEQLNASNAPGWRALKEVAALKNRLDAYHLAFCIAPRLNAAGRLDTAETALELFLTGDENRARAIARSLDEANRARQKIEAEILEAATAEIDGYFKPDVHYGLAVGRRGWHVGVIGIVASRLSKRYHRPVVAIGFDEHGSGRGSGRSIAAYNILDGLNACRGLLKACGGHAMAAGLEIEEKNYQKFREDFNRAAEKTLKHKDLRPIQTINAWIKLNDISNENFKALELLAPFGQDNPRPVFAARGVKIAGKPRIVGRKHLRFNISDGRSTAGAIAFNRAEGAAETAARNITESLLDVAFQIRKNSFNGSENLELNVLDWRRTPPDGDPGLI
ncbi:MAG: single-stranded-DNA-specific exonuclease RecJ [Kiritimatiellae bacterium]|nr:single-stranded-DNA-specific exonuclease RecJ [Kiritimatiellia bacterium]